LSGAGSLRAVFASNTRSPPHTAIVGTGHFVQEDKGEELAWVVIDFIARTA
jgi:haloalkane dehalogenase